MTTYNQTTNVFTLDAGELNFTIPATWEGAAVPADADIVGNGLANVLTGDASKNSIEGGGGDDTIQGGAGADTLVGGAGIDTLSYANAGAGVNVTLNSADGLVNGFGVGTGDQQGDNIQGFENMLGSAFGDSLNGNTAANLINGGAGNDTLVGKDGNDTIIGGIGADDMQGGKDNDLYYIDDSLDYVRERGGEGFDTVITTASFNLAERGDGEVEVLQAAAGAGAINLTGNYHTNRIIGNEFNNIIDGKAGADTMEGGAGDDVYYVDNAGDVVIDALGNNIVYTTANFNGAQLTGKVVATGTAAISLSGDAFANTILGNAGANRINGSGGNDILTGGAGKDSFVFDSNIGTYKTNKTFNFDRITDFKVKQDKILLENKIFKKLGTKNGKLKADFFKLGKAEDRNDYLVYNKNKKTLYYDVDGSGSKKAVEIIKFDSKINLTAADIWVI